MLKLNLINRIPIITWCLFYAVCHMCLCCTEPEEGCLDSTADNFEVDADIDCCSTVEECCCTYPSLSLSLNYKLRSADTSSTNFKLGQYYALDNEVDSILIDTFQLFISGLAPINTDLMDTIKVLETFSYSQRNTAGEEQTINEEDNIALIDCAQFKYTLGTYQSNLTEFNQVDFTLGLPNSLANVTPDDILDDHSLQDSYRLLFDESTQSYRSIKLKFTLKTGDNERIIDQKLDFDRLISNQLLVPSNVDKGDELIILMRINVLDVFKGIIFDTSSEDMTPTINENIVNSVIILE